MNKEDLETLLGLTVELEKTAIALAESAQRFEEHGLPARGAALRLERDLCLRRATMLHRAFDLCSTFRPPRGA